MYWTNKQKQKILITDMSDDYLLNCIKHVEDNYQRYKDAVDLGNETNKRLSSIDEQYYIEELRPIFDKYPVYIDLIEEKGKRKI
ncbi:MAG: hypothetical protein EKK57_05055 [Proteobacteria bacterium]|nr:MAG: hypothetical protein EKK57_05055 [Pseudomonadota bacterium]